MPILDVLMCTPGAVKFEVVFVLSGLGAYTL